MFDIRSKQDSHVKPYKHLQSQGHVQKWRTTVASLLIIACLAAKWEGHTHRLRSSTLNLQVMHTFTCTYTWYKQILYKTDQNIFNFFLNIVNVGRTLLTSSKFLSTSRGKSNLVIFSFSYSYTWNKFNQPINKKWSLFYIFNTNSFIKMEENV